MTQETYYDMCEQLGTPANDPPVSYNDLSLQSQSALYAFEFCGDKWDTMNGGYLGKDLNNLEFILNTLDIDKADWPIILTLLNKIISIRVDSINKKMKRKKG